MPVWFILDGDDLIVLASHAAIKDRNIRRDGRVALCVDDDHPPYQFTTLSGCFLSGGVAPTRLLCRGAALVC